VPIGMQFHPFGENSLKHRIFRFTKLAYPDAFNALSYPKFEPMQKTDERIAR